MAHTEDLALTLRSMECESCPQNLLESLSQWTPELLTELRDYLNGLPGVTPEQPAGFVPPF